MADAHHNFAYSTVEVAPSPASSGTSLTVADGDGIKFPDPPFNATVWPAGVQPISTNAEIVRVTAIDGDIFTIVRTQESTNARSIIIGDQIAATITKKTLTDIEAPLTFWTPIMLSSGAASGLQTLASASGQSTTGSLFVFPVTLPENLQFNQILLANQLSYVTVASNDTVRNTYYSKYGMYSMNGGTALSLISSSSFSILETLSSSRLTWVFPTATATVNTSSAGGWAYGTVNNWSTGEMSSYISNTRVVGLQFGNSMSFSGGVYWLAILSQRVTSGGHSNNGLSHVGIFGQVINAINSVGSVSGVLPIGSAASLWGGTNAANVTQWWGRHIVGFVTATSFTNQGGSAIPSAITLSALGATSAASTASILPVVTFVST